MAEISSRDRLSIISAYGHMLAQLLNKKDEERRYAAIVTLVFRPISGSFERRWSVMVREAERVYSTLIRHAVRHPKRPSSQSKLPIWIFAPDLPTRKRKKGSGRAFLKGLDINDGLHMHGIMLIPVESRLGATLAMHMDPKGRWYKQYVRPGYPLRRIHVEHISQTPEQATDYSLKTLKYRLPDLDNLVILPRAVNEIVSESRSVSRAKVIRDRMDETLRFWIDHAVEGRSSGERGADEAQLLTEVLHMYEEDGNAMRYVDGRGRVAWRASEGFLSLLEDLEADARADEEHHMDAIA